MALVEAEYSLFPALILELSLGCTIVAFALTSGLLLETNK